MKRTLSIACVVTASLFATRAFADPNPSPHISKLAQRAAPSATPATTPPPKPTNDLISLQLDEADLSDLVRLVGLRTGRRFVVASSRLAKIKTSIFATQNVSPEEAYRALLAVLQSNGLTVVPQDGFFRIVDSQDIQRQLTPIDRGENAPAEERYVTRIERLQHIGAEDVALNVLAKLATKDASIVPYAPGNLLIITETGANLRRMMSVLESIDKPATDAKLYFQPLSHVSSTTVAKQLDDLLDLKKGNATPGSELYVGRVVAIERPNALVIVASPTSYERILDLISRIDIVEPNEMQVHVVALQYADAKKIVVPINDAIGGGNGSAAARPAGSATGATSGATSGPATMLEGPAKISADDTTNSLIVTASPRDFLNIKDVIGSLDKPKRQVFIEAVILDLSATSSLDLGVAWHGGNIDGSGNTLFGGFRASTSALPPSASDLQGFALGVQGPSIPFNTGIPGITSIPSVGAFLAAAATATGADILSMPSITASDNTTAEIKVQLNESLQPHAPQPAQYLTGGASALPTASTGVTANYKPIGPDVKITPHLNDSNDVRLDIVEIISDVASEPSASDTYGTVSYNERSATTTMTVKDGSTVVIGGLVRNALHRTETKIPILGDLPVLGALFRTRSDTTEKSNLILILTPYIIRGEDDMRRVMEKKHEERQDLIDQAAIFSNNSGWKPPIDYKRTHGLLVEIAETSRAIERDRRDRENAAPRDTGMPVAQAPLDLPVPVQASSAGATGKPATTTPTAPPQSPTPATVTPQVRTVQIEH